MVSISSRNPPIFPGLHSASDPFMRSLNERAVAHEVFARRRRLSTTTVPDSEPEESRPSEAEDASSPDKALALSENGDPVVVPSPRRRNMSKIGSDSEEAGLPRKRVHRWTSHSTTAADATALSTQGRNLMRREVSPAIYVPSEDEADSESKYPDQSKIEFNLPSSPVAGKRKATRRTMANARGRRPTSIEADPDGGNGLADDKPSKPRHNPPRLAKAQTPTIRTSKPGDNLEVRVPKSKRRKGTPVSSTDSSDSDALDTPRTLTRLHRRKLGRDVGVRSSSPKAYGASLNVDAEDSDDVPISRWVQEVHASSSTAKRGASVESIGGEGPKVPPYFRQKLSDSEQESDAGDSVDKTPQKRKSSVQARMSWGEDANTMADDPASNPDTEDVDDLELPIPPSSKLTPKEWKRAVLREYESARKNNSSLQSTVVRCTEQRKQSRVLRDSEELRVPQKRLHRRTSDSNANDGPTRTSPVRKHGYEGHRDISRDGSDDATTPSTPRRSGAKQAKTPPSTRKRKASPPIDDTSEDAAESAPDPQTPKRQKRSNGVQHSEGTDSEISPKRVRRRIFDSHEKVSPLANVPSTSLRRRRGSESYLDTNLEGSGDAVMSTSRRNPLRGQKRGKAPSSVEPSGDDEAREVRRPKRARHRNSQFEADVEEGSSPLHPITVGELFSEDKAQSVTNDDDNPEQSDSDRTENSTRDADSAFIDDTEQAEEATRSDSDHTESSAEHTDSSTDDSEQTAAAAEEAAVTLRRMRYRNRTLKEHFRVFVQYIAELRSEPDLLSKASHDDQAYFGTAINALRTHVNDLADSIQLQTWNGAFIATLDLRPGLEHEFKTRARFLQKWELGDDDVDEEFGCQACWTRGRESCDSRGQHYLWTEEGIYGQNNFRDMEEGEIQYERKTFFKNHALVRKRPYPPDFRLVVGARCCNRANAYNNARHYLYGVATSITDDIDENKGEFVANPGAFLESLATKLWKKFKSSVDSWKEFQLRSDQVEE